MNNKWFSSMTIFSSVQWLFFIFANTIVVPISIATVFDLSSDVKEMMINSSLILTGIACVLQGWIGHRFPFMEGHSGLLWGVILNLGLSASSMGISLASVGGGVATGIIAACAVTFILVSFPWGIRFLQSLFGPMVMTVYLFLLTFQLIFIFFKGMFPVTDKGTIDIPISLFSLGIVLLVSLIKLKGNRVFSNFSILIGFVVGWFGYDALFGSNHGVSLADSDSSSGLTLFPLGQPNLELGIVVVTFFAVMMNLSNTFAAVSTGDAMYQRDTSPIRYRNSIYITSIFSVFGTGFGLVPYTPFSSSIGFLQSTRIFQRAPFFIGGGLLTLLGMIPVLGSFLATMPITVGNAVLFVAYLQLFGTAFNSLNETKFNSNTIFRLAAPVLIGISLMNMSADVFASLPVVIRPLITNGLIMGVFISILLEKMVNWTAYESARVSEGNKIPS
jgi:xanthine/uracil permease